MKRRKPCPAARLILAELAADIAAEAWRKTRSHRAYQRLRVARTEALKARASS